MLRESREFLLTPNVLITYMKMDKYVLDEKVSIHIQSLLYIMQNND